jgi:hypothetical protein
MAHADSEMIKGLDLSPPPDLIIGMNNEFVDPPSTPDEVRGVPLVYPGVHGRFVLDVDLTRTGDGPRLPGYRPLPLQGSATDPTAMIDAGALDVINAHRHLVKQEGLREQLAGIKPLADGLAYVGPKLCADCHDADADKCADHLHSHAWQTLIDAERREEWPVTYYPECVSCHVVGYGMQSGFVSPEKTPDLLNVTCESCHGPGNKHVESGADVGIPIPKPSVRDCMVCHNADHSPAFDYTVYWPMIEHGK